MEATRYKYQVETVLLGVIFFAFQVLIFSDFASYLFFGGYPASEALNRFLRIAGKDEEQLIRRHLPSVFLSFCCLIAIIRNKLSPGLIHLEADKIDIYRWRIWKPKLSIYLKDINRVSEVDFGRGNTLVLVVGRKKYRIKEKLFENKDAFNAFRAQLFKQVDIIQAELADSLREPKKEGNSKFNKYLDAISDSE